MNRLPSKYAHIFGQFSLSDIYIKQAFDYYREAFKKNAFIQHFVETTDLIPDELKAHHYIGLCDRNFGLEVQSNKTIEGGNMRGHYLHNGLFIASGGQFFRGCVVFPEFDDSGQIISAVGYRHGRVREDMGQTLIKHWRKPAPGELVNLGKDKVKEAVYGHAHH